ncbi:hypothetical protein PMIN06_011295 [Paraphaeosphaeria minitans]
MCIDPWRTDTFPNLWSISEDFCGGFGRWSRPERYPDPPAATNPRDRASATRSCPCRLRASVIACPAESRGTLQRLHAPDFQLPPPLRLSHCSHTFTMAQDLQKLKNDIWYAKQALEKQEASHAEWAAQYDQVQKILEADPNNEGVAAMVAEINEAMSQEEAKLAPLRQQLKALEAQLPKGNAAPERKYDPEQHPLLKKTLEKAEPAKAAVYNTGDVIEARFFDGLWYKAKIMTILGSSSAPKYKINYVEYNEDATVDRDAIRPIQNKRKRESEPNTTSAPAAAPSPVTSTPYIISGPASVNPKTQKTTPDTPGDDAEPKKRKIPNKKQLEQKVNNWKNWNSKGVGKKISQKDSMFRTGSNVNSRVGFTGSGSGMTETSKRVRYDNKAAAEADQEQD